MEELSKTENKRESKERGPDAAFEVATEHLDIHATRLEREGSDVDISEETAERIEKKTGKIKNLLKAASMGLALYGCIKVGDDVKDYATSRYEITSEMGEDGKVEYEHEDPETTRILKFLTGAEPLASEDRLYFYRELIRVKIRDKLVRNRYSELLSQYGPEEASTRALMSPEDLETLDNEIPTDIQLLKKQLRDIYAEEDIILYSEIRDDLDERVEEALVESIKAQVDYDPAIEKMVWDMQRKVGAPRIRWSTKLDSRASYRAADNTIYITPGSDVRALGGWLVAENAHAEQFNHSPVSSRVRSRLDEVRIQIRAIRENKSRYESQLAEYDIPGTIEHEAHEVIEPRLIREAKQEYGK